MAGVIRKVATSFLLNFRTARSISSLKPPKPEQNNVNEIKLMITSGSNPGTFIPPKLVKNKWYNNFRKAGHSIKKDCGVPSYIVKLLTSDNDLAKIASKIEKKRGRVPNTLELSIAIKAKQKQLTTPAIEQNFIMKLICIELVGLFKKLAESETKIPEDYRKPVFEMLINYAATHPPDKEEFAQKYQGGYKQAATRLEKIASKNYLSGENIVEIFNWLNALEYYKSNERRLPEHIKAGSKELLDVFEYHYLAGYSSQVIEKYTPWRKKGIRQFKVKSSKRLLGEGDILTIANLGLPMQNGISGTTFRLVQKIVNVLKRNELDHRQQLEGAIKVLKGANGLACYMVLHSYHTFTETSLAGLIAIMHTESEYLAKEAKKGDHKAFYYDIPQALLPDYINFLNQFMAVNLSKESHKKLWVGTAKSLGSDITEAAGGCVFEKFSHLEIEDTTFSCLEEVMRGIIKDSFNEYLVNNKLNDEYTPC